MKLLNKSEILSSLSKHPIGRGTEATTYDAGRYVVRVPHTVKIDKAFRENLSNGTYNYQKVDNIHGRRNFGQPLYNLTDPKSGAVMLSGCCTRMVTHQNGTKKCSKKSSNRLKTLNSIRGKLCIMN